MKRLDLSVTTGRLFFAALLSATLLQTAVECASAQLRRAPTIRQSDHDRQGTRLNREEGAVYLEGLVKKEVPIRINAATAAYSTLKADRWLGNLLPNQEATLLAISEKAYRVRARARQGQVAGWISKAAVDGVTPEMAENLTKLHERQLLVNDLIANRQVALGMTSEEVGLSLGAPDKRNSKVNKEGRTDSFEYITFERVPQTSTSIDQFGRPFNSTVWLEVETGRVTIDFEKGVATSIEESEGADKVAAGANVRIVPPPIFLF